MDRIYTNHRHGERRIHIEIDEHEIADLLDDLHADDDAFVATRKLLKILTDAHAVFDDARRDDAHEAQTSST